MNAQGRFYAARQAALEGRHEDALREFIWFHEHALEEQPSLCGVRLSYALYDWIELGKAYPPARQALVDIRDRKTQALLDGAAQRALFHDVAAINERLDAAAATRELFLALERDMPAFAARCTSSALDAIVAAGDYRLAARIRPDPETQIRHEAACLAVEVLDIKRRPFTRAPVRWAVIRRYAEMVRRHLAIAAGIGDPAQAARLQALAVRLIDNPSLRAAVRADIARRADSPRLDLYRRGWNKHGRRRRNPR